MKKHKLLFLGVALAAMPFVASADVSFEDGWTAPTYTRNSNKRALKYFTLTNGAGETTFTVNQQNFTTVGSKLVFDLTGDAPLVASPGDNISFTEISHNEIWSMHGYLYVDYNGDGGFNSSLNTFNNTDYTTNLSGNNLTSFNNLVNPTETGELVTFSCFNIGENELISGAYFVNSKGQTSASNASLGADVMPSFTLPTNLKVGTYRALFKVDWSNLDQHGAGDIGQNGGSFVLFNINVVTDRTITIESADPELGTVAFQDEGITDNTHLFPAGQTAVVVATPIGNNSFLNWTKNGEIVSTDATYTVDITDKEFTLVAHFRDYDHIKFEEWPGTVPTYTRTSNKRALKYFTLTNGTSNTTFTVNQQNYTTVGSKLVFDLTEETPLVASPGDNISFTEISHNEIWAMHGYLYIDYDKDNGFNSKLNTFENTDYLTSLSGNHLTSFNNLLRPDKQTGELVTFSAFNIGENELISGAYFVNSKGQTSNSGASLDAEVMPSFTLPQDLKVGTYRALFKVDWSNIDQHGAGDIGGNGGSFVLFNIEIENNTPRVEWPETGDAFTDVFSYNDAAHVTIKYQPQNVDADSHYIQAYAVRQANSVESAPAYRTMARAAAGETDEHGDCIYPDNFNNVEDGTLVFTLPVNAQQATLHFAHDTNGYDSNSSHTYSVTVKTFDNSGNILSESAPQTISFTTDGETSGVVDIEEAATAAPHYYNLQGIEVAQPTSAGVYIVRQGNKVSKVYVK